MQTVRCHQSLYYIEITMVFPIGADWYIICDIFCFFDVFPNGIEKSEHFISNKKRVDLLDCCIINFINISAREENLPDDGKRKKAVVQQIHFHAPMERRL